MKAFIVFGLVALSGSVSANQQNREQRYECKPGEVLYVSAVIHGQPVHSCAMPPCTTIPCASRPADLVDPKKRDQRQ